MESHNENKSQCPENTTNGHNTAYVFFWTPVGSIEHGTIVGSNKLMDGTVIVALQVHRTGQTIMMPMAAINIARYRSQVN